MIRRPPRSTQSRSSAASDVYKRQLPRLLGGARAGDDGGDTRLLGYPAQRRLGGGHGTAAGNVGSSVTGEGVGLRRDSGELGGRSHAGRVIHTGERLADVERLAVPVVVTVVIRGEDGVHGVPAGQPVSYTHLRAHETRH